jgi:hypothetical protein
MWVMSASGFYSVIEHRRDPERLIVRARAREDIEALRKWIPGVEPSSDADADYRWRAVVSRAEWVVALAQMGSEIDYPNFKAAVAQRQGAERACFYTEVWQVLRQIQRREEE